MKNTVFSNEIIIFGANCILDFEKYMNDTVCIIAYNASSGEMWCEPTKNCERNFRGQDYAKTFQFPAIVIKDYSENTGVYMSLINAGVIVPGICLTQQTGLKVYAAILTDKWQEVATRQFKDKRI